MNSFTTEEVHEKNRNDSCRRSQKRSAQGLSYAGVDHFSRQSRALPFHFTDAVKHNNRVVQGITDDRQEGCNNREGDLEVFHLQEC